MLDVFVAILDAVIEAIILVIVLAGLFVWLLPIAWPPVGHIGYAQALAMAVLVVVILRTRGFAK